MNWVEFKALTPAQQWQEYQRARAYAKASKRRLWDLLKELLWPSA
jgi:hypothetical protein